MEPTEPNTQLIEALESVLDADPDNHEVRVHLAGLLLEWGEAARALGHAARVLQVVPEHTEALWVVAAASQALEDPDVVAPAGGLPVPDTADELLDEWTFSEAVVEPDIGD